MALVEENKRLKRMYENELKKKAKRRAKKLLRMRQRLAEQERILHEEYASKERLAKNADTQTSARYGGLSLNLTQSSYDDGHNLDKRNKSPLVSTRAHQLTH